MKRSILFFTVLLVAIILTGCPIGPIDPPLPLCPPFDQGRWNTAVYSPDGSVKWDIPAYAANGDYYALADGNNGGQLTVFNEVDDSVYWVLHHNGNIKGYAWSRGQMNYLAVMAHFSGPVVDPNDGTIAYDNPSLIFIYDADTQKSVINFYVEGWYHKMIFLEGSDTQLAFANGCIDGRIYVDFGDLIP